MARIRRYGFSAAINCASSGRSASAAPGAGQFATTLHDLTVDSKGNVYTGEAATGGRVQKFARVPAGRR